jgi:2-methylcitrate dehydratase PrpD
LTGRNREADSEPAAKFSLPVSVALMLKYGSAGPDEYSRSCIGNSQVQDLADKVVIKIDEARDRVYPEQRGASVKIVTPDETHVAEVDLPKGEPESPLSEAELSDKFRRNAEKVLSPADAENIKAHILDLENRSVRDLMGFM